MLNKLTNRLVKFIKGYHGVRVSMKKKSKSTVKKEKVRKGGTFGYEETGRQKNLQQTADILGKVKGLKIDVRCTRAANDVTDVREGYSGNDFTISIGGKDKEVNESSKTKFERAVSPILFETSKKLYNDKRATLVNFAKSKHQNDVVKISDGVYSALEQRRLNSMMGYLYKGYEDRYIEADLAKAKKEFKNKKIDDPATALQAAQLGLYDKVAKSEFPRANQYVKDVERTGRRGSLILTEEYLNEVVKPWYIAEFGQEDEPEGEGGKGEGQGQGQGNGNPSPDGTEDSESEGEGQQDGEGQGTGQSGQAGDGNAEPKDEEIHTGNLNTHKDEKNWKGQKPSQRQLDYLKKNGYKGETPETKGDASELIQSIIDGTPVDELNKSFPKSGEHNVQEPQEEERTESDEALKDLANDAKAQERQLDPAKDLEGKCNSEDFTKENTEQTLEESKKEGEDMVNRIEESIADISNKKEESKPFEYNSQNGYSSTELEEIKGEMRVVANRKSWYPVKYDRQMSNKIATLFKNLRSKSKYMIDSDGSEVDVDEFIRNKTEGGVDYLKTDTPQTGFVAVIGVDESGSMSCGSRMDIAKLLCATLYKAFEKLPNVEIHVVGWTSGKVHIIRKFEDVGSLCPSSGTPFREATMWIADYVNKLPQKKKLFFQITDGDVDYDDKMKRYIQNMKRRGIICTGVQVADDGYGNQTMGDLFGKNNYISFTNMHDVKRVLIKQIAKQFARFL